MRLNERFTSGWWSLMLPRGWNGREETECTTFLSDEYPSALQVSAAFKNTDYVTDADLMEFAAEQRGDKRDFRRIEFPDVCGFYAERVDGDTFWREWWLRSKHLLIFVTYNTARIYEGKETKVVDEIVSSLKDISGGVKG